MDIELERPLSLSDAAAEAISEAIFSGQLRPGQRLAEIELSQAIGISRAPLREAFRTLATQGLVQLRQNRGAFVVEPSADQIEQMSLTRAIIEGCAARLVAHRRSPAALERLSQTIDRLISAQENRSDKDMLDAHWEFHRQVCVESGNAYLLQAWAAASNMIKVYFRRVILADAVRHDRVFMRALQTRTPDKAEGVFRSQIIRSAYSFLGRDIPGELLGYVTVPEAEMQELSPQESE
jgi:DNA-binding GntR family transcriptional regulator